MTMATAVLRNVPTMAARAPYWFVFGDQATVVSGVRPSLVMAGHES